MPGILFVSGGDDFAARIFRQERRGYWSKGLPVVLEKHGYLGFQEAGPEALVDPATFTRHDAVLVARLPDECFDAGFAGRVAAGTCGVLLEGPLPATIEAALGVDRTGPLPPFGSLTVTDDCLADRVRHLGASGAARLTDTRSRSVERDRRLDWSAIDAVPLTANQAEAWRAIGWDVVKWRTFGEPETLATWRVPGGSLSPAVVRRGRLAGCSFGLFSFLSQRHTSEPFDGAEHRTTDRTEATEHILLGLIDLMHRESHAVRPRVRPWPQGRRWALSIRHDFDRPLWAPGTAATLRRHAKAGTAATWYWRAELASARAIKLVAAAPGHEIALHTERLWADRDALERTRVEAAAGRPVQGSSAHGTPQSFRFQGAPNVLWAEEQNLLYTELIQQAHAHPHRFPALRADGTVELLKVLCLPHHESFELSYRRFAHEANRISEVWSDWADHGGLLQIMNHPDRNARKLFEVLRTIPSEERLDWTAGEAADWWRRTHIREELSLELSAAGSLGLLSRSGIEDLVIELLDPSGSSSERVVRLEAGRRTLVT